MSLACRMPKTSDPTRAKKQGTRVGKDARLSGEARMYVSQTLELEKRESTNCRLR